jgi:DNA-binding winged helix-turn-helix (wHTH) protein/TolB-like protein/Tfp pilus assembly protein PilF
MKNPVTDIKNLAAETRSFGDFTLDLRRACLLRADQEIKLRPKPFDVLKYLVENPGRVVTKEELLQAVWPDSFVTDDSLVQCLRDVRRALGDDQQRYIKTVPRRGYIFDAEAPEYRSATHSVADAERVEELRLVTAGEHELTNQSFDAAEATRAILPRAVWSRFKGNRKAQALTLTLVVLLVVLSYSLISSRTSGKSDRTATGPKVRSIAVLPFKPLNADASDEYLGLGMADTLITRLSALNQFIVRPTSAIQRYISPNQDWQAAGREQMVDAVLEGSIQRSGEKVRVTVRLLNVKDGSPLWAYKCDEYCENIFAMQDIISEEVANALALRLTGAERARLAKHYTDNTKAYQLYVKGVFFRNQLTEDGLKKSIECFQKAIELDPGYALAYAGEACSYDPLAYIGYIPVIEAQTKSRTLVMKALELDDTLAEAHTAAGEYKFFVEWDLNGGEREYKRALELNPNEQLTHIEYPAILLVEGRIEESIAMSKSGLEIDPLSPRAGKGLAEHYFLARQYDQAIEQYNKVRELFPKYIMINPGPSYEHKRMYDQAINEYLDWEARWGMRAEDIATLRQAYVSSGWRAYWQKRLDMANAEAKRKPVQAMFLASLYTRLGEKDRAIEWLQKAYERHNMPLIMLSVDPTWDSLRSDQRFAALLRRIGLAS